MLGAIRTYYRRHPDRGYGNGFLRWVGSPETSPSYSYGNGSAMRVSPSGWACNSLDQALAEAKKCAVVTHNHAEGIKGAQAVAAAVYLARNGSSKSAITSYISSSFNYDLNRTVTAVRPGHPS
ncbi:MAG: ADP-ribosylglycohydrolase family protein [Gammaproteobacteria bacterium]